MATYGLGRAARLLRVSPETVRRWADAGRLPMERDGSGNRMTDGVGLALFARERAAADERAAAPGPPSSVRNAFTGVVTALTASAGPGGHR
ncbi:MerR family DNA-binding transcriptional regulator [Streptomyces sp. CL12]|uniref:MerR family DNA-binding transcriptional regulator n=1 Tax=Streptomyces sp. CL12 TaxID=3391744 RepID=UPI003A800D12